MPASMIRKSIWWLSAIAAVVVLIVAALPMIASTRIVQDRIALEMSAWSGYRVELAAAPEIDIWPTFKAVLSDVKLSDWEDESHRPVLEAESVELELSAIAALRGDVVISTAKLVRPILYVEPLGQNRYAPVAPKGGRIRYALDGARAIVAANPASPNLSELASESFGTVEFADGQVVPTGANGSNGEPIMTGLAGAIEWGALNGAASLSATGIWRGESFSIDASSAKPLILFAGGSAPVSIDIKAAPASGSFDGVANFSQNSFFDGQLAFSSPSLRRMLEWSRTDLAPNPSTGSVALAGKITGNRKRLKFDNAEVTLDGNPGAGVLDLSLGEAVPGISGTLAFDQLDLRSFLAAFTPFTPGSDSAPGAIDVAFAEKYNLDIRLSTAKATAGDFAFTNVAATAQVKGDLTAFDISDATIFGGTVQAGLRYDRKGDSGNLEMRLLASDIDAAAAAALAKSLRVAPAGKATVSLMLRGPGRDWNSFLETAEGSFSASLGQGSVNGFDLMAFLARFKQGGFFPLREVSSGSVAIDSAEIHAKLAEGAARIEKAEARIGERVLALSGVVPYVGGGLALSGAVIGQNAGSTDATTAEASFFVGGSWSAPFVSPIFSGTSFDRPQVGEND
jgi:AsmA protein